MDSINEAVVRQLKLRKGGDDILPLWEKLWASYLETGPDGVDALLAELLDPDTESE